MKSVLNKSGVLDGDYLLVYTISVYMKSVLNKSGVLDGDYLLVYTISVYMKSVLNKRHLDRSGLIREVSLM
jgi:hypothetical protein